MATMKAEETYKWLMENGGPVIRFRTSTELMTSSSQTEISRLRKELIQSELIKAHFNRLVPSLVFNDVHSAKETSFENVMGKLTDFGLRRGIPELDQYTLPYRNWLFENVECPPEHAFDIFARTLIAAFLARAGYEDELIMGKALRNRLETVHDFVCKGNYDIYVDPAEYPKMPRSFQKRPLIDPALSNNGNFCMPWIYDVIGLAAYLPEHGTRDDWAKANAIISYVLNDGYQKLQWGYGILKGEKRHYWSMGWSIHVPGFSNSLTTNLANMLRIWLLDQLVNFEAARRHSWIKASLEHLEKFRTEKGTYLFPRDYLQEKPFVYWVVGGHMALEENRRTSKAIEVESTFWMARFKKALNRA
jgi:hypothetical protein